ncbi:MAG: hypothetical protein WCD86_14420, partial [Ktedonobacteraceae bacterium]
MIFIITAFSYFDVIWQSLHGIGNRCAAAGLFAKLALYIFSESLCAIRVFRFDNEQAATSIGAH